MIESIIPETGSRELTPEIVLVLSGTKYKQKGIDVNDIVPVSKIKAVRFCTNRKGLQNIHDFISGVLSDMDSGFSEKTSKI